MNLGNINTGLYFRALFTAFVICIPLALLSIRFSEKTGLLDRPNAEPHKLHKRTVPIGGGPALFLTLGICTLIFRKHISSQLTALIASSAIIFAAGLIDDYKALKWWVKLSCQVLACIVLMLSGTRTHLFQSPIFSPYINYDTAAVLDHLLTLGWVTFITNAFNLVDSADGLMLGISSWTLGFLFIGCFDAHQSALALLCCIMLGSCIALFLFNTWPAHLFMGDSGAQTIGFLISAISILYTPEKLHPKNTWYLPILLLGVPIFDTVLVIFSRYRKGLHFYSSGTDHSFHRLLKMGFSMHQADAIMHGVCFLLDTLAFLSISQTKIEANLIFAVTILLGFAAIYYLEHENLWKIVKKFNTDSNPSS